MPREVAVLDAYVPAIVLLFIACVCGVLGLAVYR
jgi:hypothetical protein